MPGGCAGCWRRPAARPVSRTGPGVPCTCGQHHRGRSCAAGAVPGLPGPAPARSLRLEVGNTEAVLPGCGRGGCRWPWWRAWRTAPGVSLTPYLRTSWSPWRAAGGAEPLAQIRAAKDLARCRSSGGRRGRHPAVVERALGRTRPHREGIRSWATPRPSRPASWPDWASLPVPVEHPAGTAARGAGGHPAAGPGHPPHLLVVQAGGGQPFEAQTFPALGRGPSPTLTY